VLDARSDAGHDETDAKTRKAERQCHDQQARRREDGRQDQRRSRRQAAKGSLGRDLEAAHRPGIERANDGKRRIGKAELRLPYGQEGIETVGVAVMQRVGEARTDKAVFFAAGIALSVSSLADLVGME